MSATYQTTPSEAADIFSHAPTPVSMLFGKPTFLVSWSQRPETNIHIGRRRATMK
jgi:hypothetical protein